MTCDHPMSEHVVDQHSGCIVCKVCCRIIDTEYFINYSAGLDNVAHDLKDSLYDICSNNFIHESILHKAISIKSFIRSLLPKRSILHIDLFSLYYAALELNEPYLKSELARMFGIEMKTVSKVISSISRATNHKYIENQLPKPIRYLSRLSCGFVDEKDINYMHKKYRNLPARFNLKHAELFVAAIIYNHKKMQLSKQQRNALLSSISKRLCVNRRTIKILDNDIDRETFSTRNL